MCNLIVIRLVHVLLSRWVFEHLEPGSDTKNQVQQQSRVYFLSLAIVKSFFNKK